MGCMTLHSIDVWEKSLIMQEWSSWIDSLIKTLSTREQKRFKMQVSFGFKNIFANMRHLVLSNTWGMGEIFSIVQQN